MDWEMMDYLVDNGVCEDVILKILYYEYHLQYKSIW